MSPVETWELLFTFYTDPDHPLLSQIHFKPATKANAPGFLTGWWKILLSGGSMLSRKPHFHYFCTWWYKGPLMPTEEHLILKGGSSALSFGDTIHPWKTCAGLNTHLLPKALSRGWWRLLSRPQEHSKLFNLLCLVPDVKQVVLCSKSNPPHPPKNKCLCEPYIQMNPQRPPVAGRPLSPRASMQCLLGTGQRPCSGHHSTLGPAGGRRMYFRGD